MQKNIYLILLGLFMAVACQQQDVAPLPFQDVHLNYSVEDGLWAYANEDYFFILDDSTSFNNSTGVLVITTPHPLNANFLEIGGSNCPFPITAAMWKIDHPVPKKWRLVIHLPAVTLACLQDRALWDDDYWSFDFVIQVIPP